MNGVGRILRLPGLAFALWRSFGRQKRFSERLVAPYLEEARASTDGSLGRRELYRVRNYAFRIAPSLGETFCLMRGRPMTEHERLKLTWLGALSPIFDDFFDDPDFSEERVRRMAFQPEAFPAKEARERLFTQFMSELNRLLGERSRIDEIADRLIVAQTDSRRQLAPQTPFDDLRSITYAKGGYTVLLYRAMLDHPLNEEEHRAIYELGGFMQLVEDAVDLHEDLENGIRTLPNATEQMPELYAELREKMDGAFGQIRALPYPEKGIEKTLHRTFTLCAPAFAHLRYLSDLQRKDGGVFCADCYEPHQVAFREWRTADVLFALKLLYKGY